MAVIKRTVREDGFIECLIESTNILKTEYNETTKEFIVTFNLKYAFPINIQTR
jgi:hypothetical protein